MLTRQTRDGAATTPNGLRRVKFDGSPTLSLFRAYLLDASLEDAILILPACQPNAGRMVWAKRIDTAGTAFDAIVEPDTTVDSIEGAPFYQLLEQYSGVLLLAGEDNVWYIVAKVEP